jgi:hypothetical protein
VDDLSEEQDADGRFVVRGNPPPGRLRLVCDKHVDPVEFDRGKQDLVVPFVHGCSIDLRFELPGEFDGDGQFEARLRREGSDAVLDVSVSGVRGFDPIAPGTYTVEVRLRSPAELLVVERDIVLPTPEGDFERTVRCDLRERLRVLRVRASEAGRPLLRGDVFVFVDQAWPDGLRVGQILRDSQVVLLVPRRPVDVTIAGPAYRPVSLRGVDRDVEVVLEANSSPLEVRGLPALSADTRVSLWLADERRASSAESGSVVVPGDREYRLNDVLGTDVAEYVDNGRHDIPASPHNRIVSARLHVADCTLELKAFSPKTISAGTALVTITFDPAEIQALLDAAKQTQGK